MAEAAKSVQPTGFQPGNKMHERRKTIGGGTKRHTPLTTELISQLKELNDPKDPQSRKKMEKLVSVLIANGLAGDQKAIEFIFERVDGKVPLTVLGDPENPLELVHTLRRVILDPNLGDVQERVKAIIDGEAKDVTPKPDGAVG